MEKCVFSSKRSNSLRGTWTVCCALMSSITGNSPAVSRQAEAAASGFDDDLLTFDVKDTATFSGKARKISRNSGPERYIAGFLDGYFGRGHQLDFQIGAVMNNCPWRTRAKHLPKPAWSAPLDTPMTACKGPTISRARPSISWNTRLTNLRFRFIDKDNYYDYEAAVFSV